ncbi:hypothetical protein [Streptomyces sp. NPDC047071]|uniref:hypothetical protein n=1 Tax=Streptomyces sp. NPDC047071 TaxID=3154808 RepID=UPI003454F9FB
MSTSSRTVVKWANSRSGRTRAAQPTAEYTDRARLAEFRRGCEQRLVAAGLVTCVNNR